MSIFKRIINDIKKSGLLKAIAYTLSIYTLAYIFDIIKVKTLNQLGQFVVIAILITYTLPLLKKYFEEYLKNLKEIIYDIKNIKSIKKDLDLFKKDLSELRNKISDFNNLDSIQERLKKIEKTLVDYPNNYTINEKLKSIEQKLNQIEKNKSREKYLSQ